MLLAANRALRFDGLALSGCVAAILLVAAATGPYWHGTLVLFTINALLVVSYRTITQMGGWSFAHVAIMGTGAYTVALCSKPPVSLSVTLTIALGGVVAGCVAAALAWPVLRTRQYTFFLSTFAAGEALRQCFIQFRDITGGTSGIAFIGRPELLPDPQSTLGFLWFALAVLVVVATCLTLFEASPTGERIQAVGVDEDLCASLGMNAWALRATAFVLGSVGAGLAGGLLASYNGISSPSDISAVLMFKVVAACIVGGTRRLGGPLAGLAFLTAIEEVFRSVPLYVPLIWGFFVIVVVLYAPSGLEGILGRRWRTTKEPARA